MNTPGFDRRTLLTSGLSFVGGSLVWPLMGRAVLEPRARSREDGEPPILVLVELIGGNDGLSTLVPYRDDAYYASRPTEFVPREDVLPLNDDFGFHPSLPGLRRTFEAGRMAIVRGVGYPHPVYSHFKSFEIWHTARLEGRVSGDGWIGRLRESAWSADPRPELVVHVGYNQPYSLHCSHEGILSLEKPSTYVWAGDAEKRESYREAAADAVPEDEVTNGGRDGVLARLYRTLRHSQRTSPEILRAAQTYEPRVEYPAGDFGSSLRTIAALVESRIGARVYSTNLDGFDTHGNQKRRHAQLLEQLDLGLTAFLADLEGRSTQRNVLVMVFSEFGRRVEENFSKGTDHGAAGVSFLLGSRVEGGFYGEQPSLTEIDQDGNLVYNVDFRSLYATVLEDWLGVPQAGVLPAEFPTLPILKS